MSDVLHFVIGARKWNMSGTFGGEFRSGFVDIGGLMGCGTVCTVCVYLQKWYCVECATDEYASVDALQYLRCMGAIYVCL